MTSAKRLFIPVLAAFVLVASGSCKRVGNVYDGEVCTSVCDLWQSHDSSSFDSIYGSQADCKKDCEKGFDDATDTFSDCDGELLDFADCVANEPDDDDINYMQWPCQPSQDYFMDCISGYGMDPCDQLAALYQEIVDSVCDTYPDCSVCDDPIDGGDGEVGQEVCQEAIDSFEPDQITEAFSNLCEMETEASDVQTI